MIPGAWFPFKMIFCKPFVNEYRAKIEAFNVQLT